MGSRLRRPEEAGQTRSKCAAGVEGSSRGLISAAGSLRAKKVVPQREGPVEGHGRQSEVPTVRAEKVSLLRSKRRVE